jgi:GDPmannose 4,6-dehydratase
VTLRAAVVTGITGQDGQYLADLLLAEGVRVHGVVRPGRDRTGIRPEVEVHEAVVTSAAQVHAVVDAVAPDAVFHLAGASSVAASWRDPVHVTEVNALSTAAVLDACLRTQERTGAVIAVVNASSCEIFAGAEGALADESTPLRPITPYGASKALGHNLCQVYRAQGVQASNAILYNHESPRRREHFVTRKITRAVARIAAGAQDHLALGNLAIERDWGWAPDYVEAMYAMARHVVADGGVGDDYVVATGVSHSVADFVAIAFAEAGIDDWQGRVRVERDLIRPADRPAMVGDATKAWEVLGWKPTKSFHDIVVAMVDSDLSQENT